MKQGCRKKTKNNRGITLIALAVTILALMILARVGISTIKGEDGTIVNANKAKFMTEVRDIREQIELEEVRRDGEDIRFSTLKNAIGREDTYNEILCIENGKLVYDADKVSEKQSKWLEDMNINSKEGIIPIYTETQLRKCATGETVQIEEVGGIEYVFNKDGHYSLQNDIYTTTEWVPLKNFSGIFDGNNYTINNLILNNDYDSLFYVNSGIIENLGVTIDNSSLGTNIAGIAKNNNGYIINCTHRSKEITVTGSISGIVFGNDKYIIGCCNISNKTNGDCYGIANINYGIITGCYNTGIFNTTGWGNAGIVGRNDQSGIITKCYNLGDLKSTLHTIAGIAADNSGTISSCYNVGKISGSMNVGGIAGRSSGQINNSYYLESSASSLVGVINSGEIGEECTSKTDLEMQTQNFVDDLNMTNEEIENYIITWEKGNKYPIIKYQIDPIFP